MADIMTLFDDAASVLALEPAELAAGIARYGREQIAADAGVDCWDPRGFLGRLNEAPRDDAEAERWPRSDLRQLQIAVAAACTWLETQGIVVRDPSQPCGPFVVFTRRGLRLVGNGGVGQGRSQSPKKARL